ncbi:hypothetical protein [Methylobacter sp. YRD-M1]|uniref:hypothetical protein n=1 Tax=Methylobacter sp. YRD-M1 TaxID=2911520 RepID=UPI00227B8020|nr:hypothetical protein [Methylobacter sp. YRD-M1]WAK01042.1 hypothetical protein LZ558_14515 [Methylobacter sp. YRD-M1]
MQNYRIKLFKNAVPAPGIYMMIFRGYEIYAAWLWKWSVNKLGAFICKTPVKIKKKLIT